MATNQGASPHPYRNNLTNALQRAENRRAFHGFAHRSQPGANLLDAYRIARALRGE